MKIIDARSGEVMVPGKVVAYGGGEKLRVLDVDDRLFKVRAFVEMTYRDHSRSAPRPSDQGVSKDREPLVTMQRWVTLDVRFLHPAHMFERVAFIPS